MCGAPGWSDRFQEIEIFIFGLDGFLFVLQLCLQIKAEKWISPEEKIRLEELARQEEARRLAEMVRHVLLLEFLLSERLIECTLG